ncbi:MAG: alpha-galactosidase [Bacteroidales bacterium]
MISFLKTSVLFSGLLITNLLYSQAVLFNRSGDETTKVFSLENTVSTLKVVFQNNELSHDSLVSDPKWMMSFGTSPVTMISDAGFEIKIIWTDWQAPGKKNNGDNLVILGKENFRLKNYHVKDEADGSKELRFNLTSSDIPLQVAVIYHLSPDKFYFRKKIDVTDTLQNIHYLQSISPLKGKISIVYSRTPSIKTPITIINSGGFGQPFAVTAGKTGAFFGVEYPASVNHGQAEKDIITVDLTVDIGEKIGRVPLSGEWAVIALTPEPYIQSWFYDYVKDIRVAPAEPYTLYNSWYDLRSPEYPGVKPGNIMNEENILKIIDLFKKNMIDKHNISMDAFVLDDGWDVYESDWVMRKETLPNGLKPISRKLKDLGSGLGIWFGPTGGYSFRMKRIDWMKKNAYEVVGEGRNNAMLCLGGKKYGELFEKRVTDMVKNHNVSYFKWDGIQFSCSEPDHGHPVGMYSRTAILNSLINKCNAVRSINPSVYLNITSGTWLSPWWVKYANQIWMDGGDFGFADVPSVNMRDAAITYRDFVLYDDFTTKGLWFPIANLMTHGIIKGNLENVGGENDPIDKFANDVVLYFARGISMYELYISPDLLKDEEWDVIGKSVNWAKEKKDLLSKTFMAGGNPTSGESYAYVHFKEQKGIIAARNPVITPGILNLRLKPDYGLASAAKSLVVEKVYPYRYILPRLYSCGEMVEIPLEGFETAIYEVYPVGEALSPLPAACRFDLIPGNDNTWQFKLYQGARNTYFLNPDAVMAMQWEGKNLNSLLELPQPRIAPPFSTTSSLNTDPLQPLTYSATQEATQVQISYLFKPDENSTSAHLPDFKASIDGHNMQVYIEKEKGKWYWVTVNALAGDHIMKLEFNNTEKPSQWSGSVEVWAKIEYPQPVQNITLLSNLKPNNRIFPPSPLKEGNTIKLIQIGSGKVHLK